LAISLRWFIIDDLEVTQRGSSNAGANMTFSASMTVLTERTAPTTPQTLTRQHNIRSYDQCIRDRSSTAHCHTT